MKVTIEFYTNTRAFNDPNLPKEVRNALDAAGRRVIDAWTFETYGTQSLPDSDGNMIGIVTVQEDLL